LKDDGLSDGVEQNDGPVVDGGLMGGGGISAQESVVKEDEVVSCRLYWDSREPCAAHKQGGPQKQSRVGNEIDAG
jgi:hypothetical protein